MNNYFIAKGKKNGKDTIVRFDKNKFDEESATKLLSSNEVMDFFFHFEPEPPKKLKEGVFLFSGEVGFDITLDILLPHFKNNDKVILNSGGGYNWDATQIHDYVQIYQPDAKISIMGLCASATNQILLAAKPENRTATKNSKFMIHNAWSYAVGDHNQLREQANMLEQETNSVVEMYIEASQNKEEIDLLMSKERIFDTKKALELNFISRIESNETQETNNSISINSNNNKMTEEQKASLNLVEKLGLALKNAFSPTIKNVMVQTSEGIELDFPEVESADLIKVGDRATAGGASAQGEHVMPNGETYVFENGTLTEIMPAVEETENSEQVETLTAEIANLKNQLAEKETLLNSKETEISEIKASFEAKELDFKNKSEEIQNKIAELKGGIVENKAEYKKPAEEKEETKKRVSFKIKK